ncbi:hypothetical protein PAGU2638_23980 [Lysobacter sp. PAGU 2638]
MRGRVFGAAIGFGFDDPTAAAVIAHQHLVEQFDRDDARIAPIERARQRTTATSGRRRIHRATPTIVGPSFPDVRMPDRVRFTGCLPSLIISVVLTILVNLALRACSG